MGTGGVVMAYLPAVAVTVLLAFIVGVVLYDRYGPIRESDADAYYYWPPESLTPPPEVVLDDVVVDEEGYVAAAPTLREERIILPGAEFPHVCLPDCPDRPTAAGREPAGIAPGSGRRADGGRGRRRVVERTGGHTMTAETNEVWIINGHAPWCSYIRTLEDLDDEQPCDCAGWDDPDYGTDDWDYEVDGDSGTGW